ncbi:Protein PATRONUS 2 [Vitis vinifera]|uniref:Protein PATRONUS 2 n=1 Tax=Vitis vinifera TaxID=29760 RepID=A0A438KFK2_VITVI|nr:Protein PATRONUS 2 [Vitis vinifera]
MHRGNDDDMKMDRLTQNPNNKHGDNMNCMSNVTPTLFQTWTRFLFRSLCAMEFFFFFCAEAVVGGNSKNSKTTAKKAGGLGNRKALDNITNKSTLHHETSLKKKHLPKEEFNIAEERFLHDHKKCIEVQKAATEPCFLDIVLPGHGNHINLSDSISHAEYPQAKQAKVIQVPVLPLFKLWSLKIYLDSTCDSLEPVELPMFEFLDQWKSPPSSPVHWDSPPSSPFTLQFEPVEFLLKPEKKMKI